MFDLFITYKFASKIFVGQLINYKEIRMRKFLFLSTALLIVSKNAFSLNAIPEECFLVSSSNQFGNNSEIKVTAKCDIDFSLGARILFDGGNSGSPWGSFPGGWMDWKSIANGFQYEPIDSSIKHILTIGNTLILQYSAANEASNIKIFTEAPPPPSPISGSLSIKFPEKPTGVNQDPIVTLNSEKNSLKIDGNWNSVTTKNKIPLNTYKIKANVVCDNLGNICYQGQPSANSITFTKDSPKSNISVDYKQIKQIPIELSITGLAKYINELKINFVNKDGLSFVRNINLNSNLVTNLPEGSYSIQIDKIPANDSSYYYTVQSIEPQTLEVTNSIKASIFIKFALVKNSSDFVGYYTSWSEGYADKVTDASKLKLANLPTGINIIEVSFAKPDLVYSPHSDNLSLTGLQFSGTKDPIKAAIKIAQEKGQKVLLAVGGATYNNWGNTNFHGIAQLVDDMGFDGVDIDYEMDGGCSHTKQGDGWVLQGCQSDKELTSILINMRKALPNKIISAATRSVGAEYFTKIVIIHPVVGTFQF